MSDFKKSVGKRFQEVRKLKGWSQDDAADNLNTTQATISLIERGQQLPNLEMAVKLCEAANVSLDYLGILSDNIVIPPGRDIEEMLKEANNLFGGFFSLLSKFKKS